MSRFSTPRKGSHREAPDRESGSTRRQTERVAEMDEERGQRCLKKPREKPRSSSSSGSTKGNPLDTADVTRIIVSFTPTKSYVFVGGVSKAFKDAWAVEGRGKLTLRCGPDTTPKQLHHSLQNLLLKPTVLICRRLARLGKLKCLVVAHGQGCETNHTVASAAARGGHVPVLNWLWDNKCQWNPPEEACADAASSGDLPTLKWCRAKGLEWDTNVFIQAARSGNTSILEYAVAEGCHKVGGTINIYPHAIRKGHAHVVEWLYNNDNHMFEWDTYDVLDKAVRYSGKSVDEKAVFVRKVFKILESEVSFTLFHFLKFVELGEKHFDLVTQNFEKLDGYPQIDMVQLEELSTNPCNQALRQGSMFMFDWLVEHHLTPSDTNVLSDCLGYGHMENLSLFLGRDMVWEENSSRDGFVKAAREDRLEDLQICMGQTGGGVIFGGGRGSDLCEEAAEFGAMRVLEFALEKTTGELTDQICEKAALGNHIQALKMIVGASGRVSVNCLLIIIQDGRVEMLEFLLDSGFSMSVIDGGPIGHAVEYGQLGVLKVLFAKGVIKASPGLANELLGCGRDGLMEWFLDDLGGEFHDSLFLEAAYDPSMLKLVHSRVDDTRWQRVYDDVLAEAVLQCSEDLIKWVKSTKTWQD